MRQFYGRLEKCVLSAGKTHVHKIPRFLGGLFWVFWGGGGGKCRFYFYGRADFSDKRPNRYSNPVTLLISIVVSLSLSYGEDLFCGEKSSRYSTFGGDCPGNGRGQQVAYVLLCHLFLGEKNR